MPSSTQRLGSSPHTRGALVRFPADEDAIGIIPAYAGSTCHGGRARSSTRDHPRIRGEHQLALMKPGDLVGSSPHTRGAPSPCGTYRAGTRIIPAYAGSTPGSDGTEPGKQDHPRIRGEHDAPAEDVDPLQGSSPHTRGAPLGDRDRRSVHRIIPAYAGSTWAS